MVAGPNGSGKSTIKTLLKPEWLGVYLNPDEIEKRLNTQKGFDVSFLGSKITLSNIFQEFNTSALLEKHNSIPAINQILLEDGHLSFPGYEIQSYLASVLASFIRKQLIQSRISFTFETVMSSLDKVEAMKEYGRLGAQRYLYFIATEDPRINIDRVEHRVVNGGHSVPEDKIRSRYFRSLENLLPCIRETERAFVFDNSSEQNPALLLAEITDGKKIDLKTEKIPNWLNAYLLNKAKKL